MGAGLADAGLRWFLACLQGGVDSAPDDARVAGFGVTDCAGFVDLLAGQADVGSGGGTNLVPLENEVCARSRLSYLTARLRGVVFVGRTALRERFDFERVRLRAERRSPFDEIDENLIRRDLTPAQRAKLVSKRKAAYEAVHPETKHGGAPGKAGGGKAKGAKSASFAAETAAKSGKSIRSVQVDATRAKALGADLDRVAGTSLDRGANWTRCLPRARGVIATGSDL
ncbi:hypothetical protein V1282_005387 [Nitrobacteraceae bacterium AZCC 2146]